MGIHPTQRHELLGWRGPITQLPRSWTRSLGTTALLGSIVCLVALTPSGRSAPPGAEIGEAYRIERHGPMPPHWEAATGDNRCWSPRVAEKGFLAATNESRARAGKSRLRLDPELSKVARKHTTEMTSRNLLHHTSEGALRNRVTFWSVLGENVGVGSTVDSLQKAFMNSPAHRANILHTSYRNIGFGTSVAGGRLWVTVIFQSSQNPGTTLRMPRC